MWANLSPRVRGALHGAATPGLTGPILARRGERQQWLYHMTSPSKPNRVGSGTDDEVPTYAVNRNWKLTYVNAAALAAWEMAGAHIVGRSLYEVFPSAVGSRIHVAQRKAMEERCPQQVTVLSVVSRRPVLADIQPTECGGLFITFREITDREAPESKPPPTDANRGPGAAPV